MAKQPTKKGKTPAKAKKPQPEKANETSFKPGQDARRNVTGLNAGCDQYLPEYDDLVIELGKLGKTRTQIACELGVIRETLTEWTKKHPSFSAAYNKAMQYSQAYWENKGHNGCERGHGFNGQTYQFLMKNIFRDEYTDKTTHEHTGDAFRGYMDLIRKGDQTGLPPNPHAEPEEPK